MMTIRSDSTEEVARVPRLERKREVGEKKGDESVEKKREYACASLLAALP